MTSTPNDADPKLAPSDSYWRSLNEFKQDEGFVTQHLHREFPEGASELPDGLSRRRWMQLMGASLSLAGAAGCRYPTEIIAPFVIRPEGRVPGELYGRTTNFELAGRVYNLAVTNVDGRPIKIEGNPNHPGSRGGTDVYVQASVLGLYDPDRGRSEEGPTLVRNDRGRYEPAQWSDFNSYARSLVSLAQTDGGASFAVLMSPTQSPSLVRMLSLLRERLPQMTVCRYDGAQGDAMRTATRAAIGTASRQSLDLEPAEVILTVQADILGSDPGFVHNARTFAAGRDPDGPMSRLYAVEGGYTNTGVMADTRLPMRPSEMLGFLAELERRLDAMDGPAVLESEPPERGFDELTPPERLETFFEVVAAELRNAGENAVVVVGEALGPEAVAAGIRINARLGSLGRLQRFIPCIDEEVGEAVSLGDLTRAIDAGRVETLLVLGDNPAFTAPTDVAFAEALQSVENSIYLGEYHDETSALCRWSLSQAHPLESWGDCIGDDGFYGVCQPQILPLLGGRTAMEVIARMLGEDEVAGEEIVRRTADMLAGESLAERRWRRLLHDGFDEALRIDFAAAEVAGDAEPLAAEPARLDVDVDQDEIDILFVPAEGIYDGRFANNGWLQELPQSLTKMAWDNVAVLSPRTAEALGVKNGSMIALRRGDALVELPVYEMPGCAPGVVTVTIGYGRSRVGMVGGMPDRDVPVVGTDVSPIRFADAMQLATQMEARPRYRDHPLATTQDHWAIDELGREETERRSFTLIREGTTTLLEKNPQFVEDKGPHVPKVGPEGSPFKEPMAKIRETRPDIPQWGMSIDLNKCIGCNACVVACQSENNVPIVGKEQVFKGREMHWLRIDRYFQGDLDHANVVHQPMLCQHCETAPCEQVCPVAATVHTEDGLNAMAYNRCIGTRYCANNCPFKVRRFNYFNYNQDVGVGYGVFAFPGTIENANRKLQAMVLNPDVTVRGRGVMEKCTFCVQRIEQGKIQARREGGRPIRDGEVRTACQTACPSGAIQFGNIMDEESAVARDRTKPRAYGMLAQLNVKPRTLYLARIRNTHPRLMTRLQLDELDRFGEPLHHGHHDDHHNDEHHDDTQAGRPH